MPELAPGSLGVSGKFLPQEVLSLSGAQDDIFRKMIWKYPHETNLDKVLVELQQAEV